MMFATLPLDVAETVFWMAVILIAYTYVGFPLLLILRAWLRPAGFRTAEIRPKVSLLVAAHNEAADIGAKLENILALDYPRDRLEVLVASDGSTDATNEIVRRYASQGVELLPLPRRGKAAALNAAVARSTGEVLVFSDANSIYTAGALRALVRPLADPRVGGVAGNQVYRKDPCAGLAADGEHLYWSFDRLLKQAQSRGGSVTSATGAIYAIRRALFRPVPEGVTDDFVTSVGVVAAGDRLVFAPDAVALEPTARCGTDEFGRKQRVMTRGLRGVLRMRQLLNPLRYGFYAVQLFSHKVLRRLVVFPLLLLLLVAPLLWQRGVVYQAVATTQFVLYGLAVLGWLLQRTRIGRLKILTVPFYFCLVNAAALTATVRVIRGHHVVLWEPRRQHDLPAASTGNQGP